MAKSVKQVLCLVVLFLFFPFRSASGQEGGFVLGGNEPRNRAVTDPVPAWHTYMGSAGDDYSNAIALDANGNIYLAGWSAATWGTPINPHSGGQDCFVAKLNSSGVLQWHTFMGAAGDDHGKGIALDASGNIYVGGYSNATWGSAGQSLRRGR